MAATVEYDKKFVTVGQREDLNRLLAEYHLDEQELGALIRVRQSERWVSGHVPELEYLVHESVLRSYGDFACAGDNAALAFCEDIAGVMVGHYAISRSEAVARINRQWSHADGTERVPHIWIVGSAIVYHDEPEYWAALIYYGPDSR